MFVCVTKNPQRTRVKLFYFTFFHYISVIFVLLFAVGFEKLSFIKTQRQGAEVTSKAKSEKALGSPRLKLLRVLLLSLSLA